MDGNVLFNDALNTFLFTVIWRRTYGKRTTQIARGRKEEFFLFNDALNTFDLQLYGVGHMVKDHSDSERKEGRKCFI